ncbi:hypothetical protein ABH935_003081 [Catenulispora sp. GAS73]|uniref:hypothetical protein n=1 Tax=Catenulispora sp. GAS73 TaxID=3156269 RepID=UPI0035129AE2
MPDLDTREDDWARGVFDRVRTGQDEPRWIPDAEGASRLSTRHRQRRTRVAGAVTMAAVIGVSATAYATLGRNGGDNRQVTPPAATTSPSSSVPSSSASATSPSASTPSTTPSTSPPTGSPTTTGTTTAKPTVDDASLGEYFQFTGGSMGGSGFGGASKGMRWSTDGMATIGTVWQGMDPTLGHVRALIANPVPLPLGLSSGERQLEIYGAGYWTPNGDITPMTRPTQHPTTPFGYVTISSTSPIASNDGKPNGPCGIPDQVFGRSLFGIPTAWSPCDTRPQSDGSVIVTTHAQNLAEGTSTIAVREFPSGAKVMITAASYLVYYRGPGGLSPSVTWTTQAPDYVAGPKMDSVPWTDDSLAAALSAPGVKGLP